MSMGSRYKRQKTGLNSAKAHRMPENQFANLGGSYRTNGNQFSFGSSNKNNSESICKSCFLLVTLTVNRD